MINIEKEKEEKFFPHDVPPELAWIYNMIDIRCFLKKFSERRKRKKKKV